MKKETILAGIFGAVVGDALGVPYEFTSRTDMQEKPATTMRGYGTYNQPVGTWSDDSSMTLATLESLTNGVDYEDMMQKYCQWYRNAKYTPHDKVFDIGVTTRSALINYIYERKEALKSGLTGEHDNGNGSLMRILPATLYNNAKKYSMKEQIEYINNISSLTHAHKYSMASCNIYNMIIQEILDNPGEELREHINKGIDKSRKYYENEEYPCFLNIYDDISSWKESLLSGKGYVVYSLETSLYYAYHTNTYKESVLKAVNLGGDTDTNAMITGGLTGLYYGYDSIPQEWIEKIVRKEYIQKLCENFHNSLK